MRYPWKGCDHVPFTVSREHIFIGRSYLLVTAVKIIVDGSCV